MQSKKYFDEISNQWDTIRQSFFSDSIRDKMCETAQVKEGLTAVDIGAGTGFVTQELLSRKLRVIAIDQSQEMLDVIKQKFASKGEVICLQADAYSLPLEDESVDYVMANMFLHHVEKPDQAILEMTRILKPGGRLVIADLDKHDFEFLRIEQFDVWLGFERSEIREWFSSARLIQPRNHRGYVIAYCLSTQEMPAPSDVRIAAPNSLYAKIVNEQTNMSSAKRCTGKKIPVHFIMFFIGLLAKIGLFDRFIMN